MQEIPDAETDFGYVSCSCRACERAGEAKPALVSTFVL